MDAKSVVDLVRVRALCATGAARKIRLGAGLSLPEMASPVGVVPATIYRWETGSRTPRGAAALRYGRLLEELMRR